MSVKIVKFHRTSKRGETSKFNQNPRPRGAARARTTSFKFSRSAKRGYSEGFKFSRATKHELAQTAHLKSTPKGRAPCAPKSRCNEARCENTPPRHTQRTQKNPPKRCELRAIKILPQRRAKNTVKFRYKDRCSELKRYARQAVNFINLADRGFRYEFKFGCAINRVAARHAWQGGCDEFKFNDAASYKFNQTVRHVIALKQRIWRFAKIPSQWRAWQTAEILPQRYARQKIEIPSQWHARRSMRQTAEISPRQCARQTVRILQKCSLPCAAKILLLRHMHGAEIASAQIMKALLFRHVPQAEISRAENCENSAAMRRAASRRNFIEAARMTSHQILAENHKIIAENCKILIERHKIPTERGAA